MGWGQRGPLLLPAEFTGLGFTGFAEEAKRMSWISLDRPRKG